MTFKEENRKIIGASAHNSSLSNKEWLNHINSTNYTSCPEEFKTFIKESNLEELVYWKLKDMFEKKDINILNEILKGVISDIEPPLFNIILKKTNGNQSKAAEVLGCNRNTLHRKLKDFFINPKNLKKSFDNNPYKKSETSLKEEDILTYL